MCAENTNEHH